MDSRLLDAHGRPVRRQQLTRPQAEPSLTGIRNAWAPTVASGLTPSRLAAILRSSAEGDLHDYLTLAEEMEERDAHYASVLGVRKRAVSGVTPIVKPASEDARDKKIAEAVKDAIADHDGFADMVEDLLDALGKGFSVLEIDWQRGAREWTPRDFQYVDPRFFTFDRETGRELRLLDERDLVEGIPLEPFRFITHRPRLKSGLALRGGLARLVAFGWICKAYTVKDWVAFVETYGLPLRLGRYGPEATKDDVNALARAVANIGTDAAAVLPESMRIDFEEVSRTGNDPFETLARWVDEQTSKAVLGQTMTSDDGASMAQAKVHNEVRLDIAQADARSVSGTINRDLVIPFVDLNFGRQANYPRLVIEITEPEDTKLIMEAADKLIGKGLKVRSADLRSRLGLSDPDQDDEVIGGPAPAAPSETPRVATNREVAELYADVDALEEELSADWQDVMGDALNRVLADLGEASSYDDARRIVTEAFPNMQSARMIDGLVVAMFQARAEGEASDA